MNEHVKPTETALALYATACETHMRRDWREASHALAKALKLALAAGASRAALETASPAPAREEPAAKPAKAAARAKGEKAAALPAFDMSAGSLAAAMRFLCKVACKPRADGKGIPVLEHVLICALGDALTISATNLDIQASVIVADAPGVGKWTAVVPAHEIAAALKGADKAKFVTMALEGATRFVMNVPGRREFATLAPADWPHMDVKGELRPIAVNGAALADAFAYVRQSISTEETRYYLNGICLHGSASTGIRAVATDGRRLSCVTLAPHTGEDFRVIIPAVRYSNTAALIAEVAASGAWLELGAHQVKFTAGAVCILSKLIDGSFPDYQRVVPADNNRRVAFDRAAMLAAIKSGSVIFGKACNGAGEKTRSMAFRVNTGEIVATFKAPDVVDYSDNKKANVTPGATAVEKLAATYDDAETIESGFNAELLGELLAAFKGDRLTMALEDPDKGGRVLGPALITSEAEPDRFAVIMPLRA